MVAAFDLHGILTAKMLQNLDGFAVMHTYPHIDMPQVGEHAAHQLLALMDQRTPPAPHYTQAV